MESVAVGFVLQARETMEGVLIQSASRAARNGTTRCTTARSARATRAARRPRRTPLPVPTPLAPHAPGGVPPASRPQLCRPHRQRRPRRGRPTRPRHPRRPPLAQPAPPAASAARPQLPMLPACPAWACSGPASPVLSAPPATGAVRAAAAHGTRASPPEPTAASTTVPHATVRVTQSPWQAHRGATVGCCLWLHHIDSRCGPAATSARRRCCGPAAGCQFGPARGPADDSGRLLPGPHRMNRHC